MRNGDETIPSPTMCPRTSGHPVFHGRSEVCRRSALSFGIFNMSISCLPSIPCLFLEIPPFVLFAIWRRNAHLRVSSRQNCIVIRSTHVPPKHDCAPQTRITWLEGRENHFMGVRAKIYSSRLEVLLLHRLDDGSRNLFLCLRSWFPKFVRCSRLWKKRLIATKKKKKLEGNWKIFKKREGRKREFIINCIYL